MKIPRWSQGLIGGLLLVCLVLAGHAEARNIKVGIIDCYSGPPAVYGNDALNGFKLALEEINQEGVLGGQIEFTTRDTKFKVDIALNMAKELVMREEVDILAGIINSGAGLAVSEAIAKKEQVPLFIWIAKSENITGAQGHRYVFSTSENSAMAGKAGGVALSKKPYVTYWIAGDDYEYGHAIADAAWRNLQALRPDVEMIGESWWKPGEPDLIPYLTSIESAKPDAVIFATGGRSMTNLMKAIKATGMAERIPIWVHTGTDHAVLKPLAAEAPEGVMGTMDYHFYYPDTPANQAFVEAFENAYGNPPGFPAFHGYITAKFIAEAYRKAGELDTEKFIDALEGLKIDSPVGEIEMRGCDHQAVLPLYLGVTKMSPEYGFVISSDIMTLTGDKVMPTCEEILKARGE
ncbi:ABC transporter substrate-binding protein [candidate division KSB3 bacterium]|uniref:ABC transporter substrate-binding protein n=1 Tax=candidate division KSB3 bacterium TaxID=2044937 RepID=A0A9D5Q497_9BACT|nr:ABC transporter substrate-binding protein [candidate division KSB3 bacterium]MBD3323325.1 ABC transporter substrate-binding protein [candidate division KSB3 bacterium]